VGLGVRLGGILKGYLGVANVYAHNDSKTKRFFYGRKLWSRPSHVIVDGS